MLGPSDEGPAVVSLGSAASPDGSARLASAAYALLPEQDGGSTAPGVRSRKTKATTARAPPASPGGAKSTPPRNRPAVGGVAPDQGHRPGAGRDLGRPGATRPAVLHDPADTSAGSTSPPSWSTATCWPSSDGTSTAVGGRPGRSSGRRLPDRRCPRPPAGRPPRACPRGHMHCPDGTPGRNVDARPPGHVRQGRQRVRRGRGRPLGSRRALGGTFWLFDLHGWAPWAVGGPAVGGG